MNETRRLITTRVTNEANQPDLRGNLRPVGEHERAACEVIGEIPAGLRGTFIRNGPNPAFEPIAGYHMFDGDGMLHAIDITGASADAVSYSNRFIRSRALERELEHGSGIYPGLAEVNHWPSRELTKDAGAFKNPANTHIIRHAGKYLALWEGGVPTEVRRDLSTVGEYDFGGRLEGSMTAHPRLDPVTGEMFFFAYSLFAPWLRYHVVNPSGELVHSIEIDLPAPVMMHDFIITEEHAVFLDSPIVFDVEAMGTGPMTNWTPENGTRIGVMPRMGSADDLVWYDIEPGHVQHFWNGWLDRGTGSGGGDRIEFSGSRLANPDFGIDPTAPLDEQVASNEAGSPARFFVDLGAGTAGWEPIDDLTGDFCRINDDMNGRPNRFGYLSALSGRPGSPGDFDMIAKYDLVSGDRTEWHSGPHGHVGESVFAADPDGSAEDDGWLLNAVYFDDTDRSELVILDARTVENGPIARIVTPQRVPFGFHANWFAPD